MEPPIYSYVHEHEADYGEGQRTCKEENELSYVDILGLLWLMANGAKDGEHGAGGRGGIRTHEGAEPLPVFKTGALNHSATLPSL